LNDSIKTFTS